MPPRTDRQTHQFPDGSEVEFAIQTSDTTVFQVFTADVSRRFRRAQRTFGADASLAGTGTKTGVLASTAGARQSTTTYDLPGGEVTVSIDASGTGSHAYLRSLVQGAVEYTHTLQVEVWRALFLAVLSLGGALALVAVGRVFLSVPLFGVSGSIALHLAVYWLSARGVAPNLSQVPDPGGRSR
jgi:hypothetical protein